MVSSRRCLRYATNLTTAQQERIPKVQAADTYGSVCMYDLCVPQSVHSRAAGLSWTAGWFTAGHANSSGVVLGLASADALIVDVNTVNAIDECTWPNTARTFIPSSTELTCKLVHEFIHEWQHVQRMHLTQLVFIP